jgi:drug/metabolite transporter (DMT)-like permease
MDEYLIGVLAAILGGSISSVGVILQKRVVNQVHSKDKEKKFFRSLVKNPVWLLGLILGTFVPAIFVITAQLYVGPALTPGLMSAGLIVLAIGSVRINKEHLERSDYAGILLMIVAIFFLGGSQLSVPMATFDLNAQWVLTNSIAYGLILFALSGLFAIVQKGSTTYRAIWLIFAAGCMFAQQNFWIAPLSGTIYDAFVGTATTNELIFFVVSAVVLVMASLIAIVTQQTAYKYGQACTLNTLQQFPTQMSPPVVYLLVFQQKPPNAYSLLLLVLGIVLVLVASYLLARRKVEISKIK